MQINGNSPLNSLYKGVLTPKQNAASNPQANNMLTEKQSAVGDASRSAWQQIAAHFDVTNISTSERGILAQQLADNGLISSDVQLKLAAPSNINDDFQTKSNFLAEMQHSQQVQQGDPLALKTLKVLQQLNGLSTAGSQVWQGYAKA